MIYSFVYLPPRADMARTEEQQSALDTYYGTSRTLFESWGRNGPSPEKIREAEEAELNAVLHGIPRDALGLSTARASRAATKERDSSS